MRLSTGDQRETIRMEDVVFTLNNIVDEIASMYADSFDHVSLEDSSMEIDATQSSLTENESEENTDPSAQPDSPTLSEPPLSARSTESSGSDDSVSLYSTNQEPSPTSSGFTTPSESPTSLTFITDKGATDSATAINHSMAEDVRTDMESIGGLKVDPEAAPTSLLEVPSIKLEPDSDSKPFSWTPSLSLVSGSRTGSSTSLPLEQNGAEIIYQTSTNPPVFLITPSVHMPGVHPPHLSVAPPRLPPRPTHPRDSPPHLPALRSPTLQCTPKLDQNEDWDTSSQIKRNGLGATHLVRQRQWARMTITYASSLAEPQNLPACRPVDKYLEWNSNSALPASPPRRRTLGAMGRRVHVGPRMLPRGDWDPERRGGAIDRWNYRETLRRERTRPYSDTERASRPKLRPIVPLRIDTSRDHKKSSGAEREIQQDVMAEDDVLVSPACGTGSTQENEEPQKERITVEGNRDTMRLCVKGGKRVLPGPVAGAPNPDSDHQSQPKSPGSTATPSPGSPVDDPNMMRWCVKNGVRVSSTAEAPGADPNSKSEVGSSNAPEPTAEGTSTAVANPQSAPLLIDQPRLDTERPYVPKKKSPLSRTLLPASSSTMKFQLRTPGDALSIGKARRKFASMMF